MCNKKSISIYIITLVSAVTVAAAEIRNVTAKQRFPWNGKVDIKYEVVCNVGEELPEWNHMLVVSVTNRVAGTNYIATATALTGDIGANAGTHHVVWDLNAQGLEFKSDDVVFQVAYATRFNVPGNYCVIDLSGGNSATSYPVVYMVEPPSGGFNTDEYKTTKLVLRLIEPGSFKMGSSYVVTLTKPFYCGLFEVTNRQWELITGSEKSYGDSEPVDSVSYNAIRGSVLGAEWPTSSSVDDSSFLGKLCMRTGIDFDLPTEAQWEYACRAGTTTRYSYGDECDGSYMWYRGNTGSTDCHIVGTRLPNPWGLYDMHGNRAEWCLDWYASLSGGIDPKGPSSGTERVVRGGNSSSDEYGCTSNHRSYIAPSSGFGSLSFRIVRTL